MGDIYSTGHSNKPIEQFIKELKDHNVSLLVDVRSQPYSKYVPQYNKDNLMASLEDEGIKYLYFGDKLGGRPPEGLDAFVKSERFMENVTSLLSIVKDVNAAIMCSEVDQEKCHRRFIIDEINSRDIGVKIIQGSRIATNNTSKQLTFDDL